MLDDGRRLELLAAIGIDVYRLRRPVGEAAPAGDPVAAPADRSAGDSGRLAIVCQRDVRVAGRSKLPIAALLRALRVGADAVTWVETSTDGSVSALPDLPAYLMIGAAAARAASAQLKLTQQQRATIVVTDEAPTLLRDAAAKRALWQALKPLARRLRG